jgi:hypothetical protein
MFVHPLRFVALPFNKLAAYAYDKSHRITRANFVAKNFRTQQGLLLSGNISGSRLAAGGTPNRRDLS